MKREFIINYDSNKEQILDYAEELEIVETESWDDGWMWGLLVGFLLTAIPLLCYFNGIIIIK